MRTCAMMMKKMKDEGMEIGDKVSISYQEVINRAAGDPPFRSSLVANPEETLNFYHYQMKDEEKTQLVSLISAMQDTMRGQVRNMLERARP